MNAQLIFLNCNPFDPIKKYPRGSGGGSREGQPPWDSSSLVSQENDSSGLARKRLGGRKNAWDSSLSGFIWRREKFARDFRSEICNIYSCSGIQGVIAKKGHLTSGVLSLFNYENINSSRQKCRGRRLLTISFTFKGKDRKMQRSKNEVLSKALTRAELSSKKKAKKVKRSADLKISIGKTPKNHEEFLFDRNTQYRDYLQKHTIFSIFF